MIKGDLLHSNEGSDENSKTGRETFRFAESTEGKILSVTRLKKTSCKTELMEQIGVGLRSVYDDVLAQPVPDRFFELLRQLESSPGVQAKKDAT